MPLCHFFVKHVVHVSVATVLLVLLVWDEWTRPPREPVSAVADELIRSQDSRFKDFIWSMLIGCASELKVIGTMFTKDRAKSKKTHSQSRKQQEQSRSGVGKLRPAAQIRPGTIFNPTRQT